MFELFSRSIFKGHLLTLEKIYIGLGALRLPVFLQQTWLVYLIMVIGKVS